MKQHYIMPVGVDDFKRVREEYYYVDKTDLIRSLIDGHSQVTLITRPRRFGKTLAMSMLYYFFTMKDAKLNRNLFEGCSVERAGEKYMALQGSKPVIFLSLKDIKEANISDMLSSFEELSKRIYYQFRYLLDGDTLLPGEKASFLAILDCKASRRELQFSLSNLMTYLARYYQQPVMILIDEYDTPIQTSWEYGYYDEAIVFMRNYLSSVLKSNPDLDFAVITGVLRIAKESIFSSLNNLKVSSLVSGSYAEAMGFTEEEVRKMAADFNAVENMPQIKEWYDGYSFAGKDIYNPWSVINYFDNQARPGLYWLNTSGNSILAELLKHVDKKQEKELKSLLQGGSVTTRIDESVIYDDIYKNRNALYTMLLTTGYLTLADEPKMHGYLPSASLRIPNREVCSVYAKEIVSRIEAMEGSPNLLELMENLLNGNAEEFSEGLNEYLLTLASYYDTANRENFYHGFVLGLLALLVPDYKVRSNRESGYGRFDVAIFPSHRQGNGVIMEFKVAESENELPAKAEEALAQIESMDYLAEFRNQKIEEVWLYGIAFCGKKCHIRMKSIAL